MGNTPSELAHTFQLLSGQRLFLGAFGICDVYASRDVTGTDTIWLKARDPVAHNRSVLSVCPAQPVLDALLETFGEPEATDNT